MPSVTFNSTGTPLTLSAGIPSLTTDILVANLVGYSLADLSDIFVYLDITPPTGGAHNIDVFFGPDSETSVENLTAIHNSFQGNLSLSGITYSTDRVVYSLPLSHWLSSVVGSMSWKLWVYNWAETFTGTLNSWKVIYSFGQDTTQPAVPLNPLARNLGKYYGVGSSVSEDITYTLKDITLDGVVGYVFPVDSGLTQLRNAFFAARNFAVSTATVDLSLIKNQSGVETTVWSGTLTLPVGNSRGLLSGAVGTFAVGDRLYFKITNATTTSVDLTIQATMTGG